MLLAAEFPLPLFTSQLLEETACCDVTPSPRGSAWSTGREGGLCAICSTGTLCLSVLIHPSWPNRANDLSSHSQSYGLPHLFPSHPLDDEAFLSSIYRQLESLWSPPRKIAIFKRQQRNKRGRRRVLDILLCCSEAISAFRISLPPSACWLAACWLFGGPGKRPPFSHKYLKLNR